jgi:hypothetical protein
MVFDRRSATGRDGFQGRPSAARVQKRQQGEIHGQSASDRRLSRARHRPALDRPGHRRDRLAASSFMINQLQWAGYGALLGAVGLILIWQGKR